MRCLPLVDIEGNAHKEDVSLVQRQIHIPFPTFSYNKKGNNGKRTKVGPFDFREKSFIYFALYICINTRLYRIALVMSKQSVNS